MMKTNAEATATAVCEFCGTPLVADDQSYCSVYCGAAIVLLRRSPRRPRPGEMPPRLKEALLEILQDHDPPEELATRVWEWLQM
ncbi:MAG TPA: hypothetical protein VFD32_17935 [Dehalococcoidia bacterium]|nr:hypothetical protein [Dehalococcoidia bacterium]